MNREEQGELPVSLEQLEPLDHVDQLILQGKLEEAIEIIEGREMEEGLGELRWRIVECRYCNIRGEFEQVIEIVEEIKKELEVSVEQKGEQTRKRIRIDALNEQVWALLLLARLEEGMEKVEEGIELIEELDELEETEETYKDKERKTKLLLNKGRLYWGIGESDQALNFCEKSLTLSMELENKQLIATCHYLFGVICDMKGELGQALNYYEKCLVIFEELGNKQFLGGLFNNLGKIYVRKGALDQALEYNEKSLAIYEKLGNKQYITYSLHNIGIIYRQKGELGQALEKLKRSLVLREKIGNKQTIAISLNSIGVLYQELGALEKALDLLKQSLIIREEMSNNLDLAYSLFSLIGVTIDLEDIKQAKEYLSDLQQINEQEENKRIDLQSRLAKALVLKTSKRRKNLTRAEEILEEIVEEEIIEHDLTVHALLNLSELLLEELRFTGDEEILEELKEKVDRLFKIAKEQQSYSLLTESYWLKAQLALVRLDLKEARNLLSQAQEIAEERGLEKLARKISSEHDYLLHQLAQWEELIAKDASIAERVKVANLEELMGWMARKREIIIDEPEDEPIMLLLVAESGLPIYSKQFSKTEELQDMLISGFLTSINSFVQEAFHVTGMIRRITHDEYTLSFNLIEPILFCYVYEGQSYTAMKKLEKLIIEVQTSEVWSALEEVGKKGYGLKSGEIAHMEGVIEGIFQTN